MERPVRFGSNNRTSGSVRFQPAMLWKSVPGQEGLVQRARIRGPRPESLRAWVREPELGQRSEVQRTWDRRPKLGGLGQRV